MTVAPAASSPTVWLDDAKCWLNPRAPAQTETLIEFPHVPADLDAHSPTEPCPAE